MCLEHSVPYNNSILLLPCTKLIIITCVKSDSMWRMQLFVTLSFPVLYNVFYIIVGSHPPALSVSSAPHIDCGNVSTKLWLSGCRKTQQTRSWSQVSGVEIENYWSFVVEIKHSVFCTCIKASSSSEEINSKSEWIIDGTKIILFMVYTVTWIFV